MRLLSLAASGLASTTLSREGDLSMLCVRIDCLGMCVMLVRAVGYRTTTAPNFVLMPGASSRMALCC